MSRHVAFFLSLEAVLLIHKEHIDSEMESSHYVILQTLAEPFLFQAPCETLSWNKANMYVSLGKFLRY